MSKQNSPATIRPANAAPAPAVVLSPENLMIAQGVTKIALKPHQIKDQEKYQTTFDPKLENGPNQDRSCTDIICCLIFILFVAGWIFIFGYGLSKGDPGKLMTPFDEKGKGCGYSAGYENYPFIFFYAFGQDFGALVNPVTNPNFDVNQIYTMTFCVDNCPNTTVEAGKEKTRNLEFI